MSPRLSVGQRLRALRLEQGLKQGDLARIVSISPSYLNLIEHDRRRISGRVLADLARALDVPPEAITQGPGAGLVSALEAAAAEGAQPPRHAADLAARFPDWAQLIADQARALDRMRLRMADQTDRAAHDPQLASALHDILSLVTSIRSTAAILSTEESLDPDWRSRFHGNLHQDALRLTESSGRLTAILGPGEEVQSGALEEVEAFFDALDHEFTALEQAPDPTSQIAQIVESAPQLHSAAARKIAAERLRRVAEDLRALPSAEFAPAAKAVGHDPLRLMAQFGVPLDQVLRRLVGLPKDGAHPRFGLAICDGGGGILHRARLDSVIVRRGGAACPLWPLFAALARPGHAVTRGAILPGAGRLLIWAIAQVQPLPDPDADALVEATMLIRLDPGAAQPSDIPLGPGCRSCPRRACAARREPSVLPAAQML